MIQRVDMVEAKKNVNLEEFHRYWDLKETENDSYLLFRFLGPQVHLNEWIHV